MSIENKWQRRLSHAQVFAAVVIALAIGASMGACDRTFFQEKTITPSKPQVKTSAGKEIDRLTYQLSERPVNQVVIKYDFGITCVSANWNSIYGSSLSCVRTPYELLDDDVKVEK